MIVEDGTGRADANAYLTVAEANAYHEARGNTEWEAVAEPEQAIVRATDYMLQAYRGRWIGERKNTTQALDWPRLFWYPEETLVRDLPDVLSTTVPPEVKKACAELALRAAVGSLAPDLARGKQSVSVGPISVVYDRSDPQHPRYSTVDGMLRPYLKATAGVVRLIPT